MKTNNTKFSAGGVIAGISCLGLGTGMLGRFGTGASAREVEQLLGSMLAEGVTVIDTADTYGSGEAERLLAAAMRGRRDEFFLMTKAGYRHGDLPWPLRPANPFVKKVMYRFGKRQCFTPDYLERCLERSLKRLATNRVDVFFLHDPSLEDLRRLHLLQGIAHLRTGGMAGNLGISSGDPEVLDAALSGKKVDFIQCPANLADASGLVEIWKACEEQGVRIVANHVMGRGDFGFPGLTHEIRVKAAAALLPPDAVILCGTRNPRHLAQTKQWLSEPMTREAALAWMERVAGTGVH